MNAEELYSVYQNLCKALGKEKVDGISNGLIELFRSQNCSINTSMASDLFNFSRASESIKDI